MGGVADIETRADCERLVRAFYGRALEDPIIGFIFTDVAKLDLEAHVPRIASFWETILLGARSYGGGAFAPHARVHAKVRLREGHFARWLALWNATVDELFAGERAELRRRTPPAWPAPSSPGWRATSRPPRQRPLRVTPGFAVTRHGPPRQVWPS